MIEGSVWEKVIYPETKTDESRKMDKKFQIEAEKVRAQITLYEDFFNNVLPNIEL